MDTKFLTQHLFSVDDATSLFFLLPMLQPPWLFVCDEGLTLSLLSCLASLLRTLSSPLPQHFLEAVPKIFGWYFYFVGGPCPCVLGVDTVESTKLTNLILILK